MTIPRNRLFKNSKGFQAQADVGINSPHQTNTQSVNVILQPSSTAQPLTKDKSLNVVMNKANIEEREIKLDDDESLNDIKIDDKPLNDELDKHIKARSIETAKENLDELQSIIKNKDNLIEALSLILDVYENNPLIINKYIISKEDELTRLLFLLTGADSIEIIKDEPDIGCCKFVDKFNHINKILIHKDDSTYHLTYSFPNVANLLEQVKLHSIRQHQ